ncbi:MAG: SIMPL domain-containing protein [Candidatus Binatus sp.]|uniref:SIMPL domain-containing protein n=1 Tax=Candidatus Binatus sp. TaxID=2811406 RepID=UPI0027195556|nr:SIMPL domain-containing protein [Candidatus Binatus sp.]MDO8434934.1 SIMPL domain-containing protein [Candidatus Binatus sp.]
MKFKFLISVIVLSFAFPMLASISFAQVGAAAPPIRVIEVDGTGEARGTPDVATLNLAIETHAATAEEAASRNGTLAEKIIAALKAKLGDKGKISTGGYSLNPEYDQRPSREPKIVSYTAQNSITAETGALDLLGALIDASIAAGANRVNYLSFALKDDSKVRTEAITIATRDAKAQADALAAALGVKLGKVIKATTVAEARPIPMQRMGMAVAAERVATPVEPGEVTVPVTVSLTFYIE